jgi:hypothetical protein
VLLDDPLASVDAPTAVKLLHRAILGALKGRTCVLVTHASQLVEPHADFLIVVKDGEIAYHGKPLTRSTHADQTLEFSQNVQENLVTALNEPREATPFLEELKSTGSVPLKFYARYFVVSGGIFFVLLFSASFILVNGSKYANDWWLKHWTDSNKNLGHSDFTPWFFVEIYALIGIINTLMTGFLFTTIFAGSYFASKTLHSRLLDSIIRSPLLFFQITRINV